MTRPVQLTADERFAFDHRTDDAARLALRLAGRKDIDTAFVLRQVDGWQRLSRKVPAWAACAALHYPPRLSVEQASGQAAAEYKACLARRLVPGGGAFADLTGGFGVDFAFVAAHFSRAVYMERNAELCRLARHNFPLVGAGHAEVENIDSTGCLDSLGTFDLLLVDPARRDAAGRKTVSLEDCEPDLTLFAPRLLDHAPVVMAKLSPMLDQREAVRRLPGVAEVHLVGAGGECKELLVVLRRDCLSESATRRVRLTCVEISGAESRSFSFEMSDETAAFCPVSERLGPILLDPGPTLTKSGAFRAAGVRFGLSMIGTSTHLYTSDAPCAAFPGRQFAVEAVYGFDKRSLRELRTRLSRANLAVRGFPATVDELRRRLKLADGGDSYLFAAQTAACGRCLILCRRL